MHKFFAHNKKKPLAYLRVDREGRLLEAGGNWQKCGLGNLMVGQPVSGQIDFLVGMLPLEGETLFLPYVSISPGLFIDIHLIATEDYDLVLVFDSSRSAQNRKDRQQKLHKLLLWRDKIINYKRKLLG